LKYALVGHISGESGSRSVGAMSRTVTRGTTCNEYEMGPTLLGLPSQRLWLRAYNWCCGRGWQQLGERRRVQARSDRLLAVAPARVGRQRSPPPQSQGIPIWGFVLEAKRPKSIAGTEEGGALEKEGTQVGVDFSQGTHRELLRLFSGRGQTGVACVCDSARPSPLPRLKSCGGFGGGRGSH